MVAKFINIGPRGTFESSGSHNSTPFQIDEVFDHLYTSGAKSLVLYFHGGLVSESAGIEIAQKMAPVYHAAGAVPLTFVWETGLVETFRDNLSKVNETDLYKKLLKLLLKRVAKRFGGLDGRGAGEQIPMSTINNELAKDRPFESYDSPITNIEDEGASSRGIIMVTEENPDLLMLELQEEFQQDIESDESITDDVKVLSEHYVDSQSRGLIGSLKVAKLLAVIAFRVIRRHVRGRDHGFYPTVVEELLRELYVGDIGGWVWSRMKDKAGMMWLPNDGLIGNERRVGSYVLDKLAILQAVKPDFRVDLVGHSAGSIAICELLRVVAARNIPLQVNTIAFLAPAGRSELGVTEIVRHPERYKQFRCYTMADEYEREDSLLPGIYTRSLLYLVSGLLEPDEVDVPLMGMMRHASGKGPFESGVAAEWASYLREHNRLVLSDSSQLNPDALVGRRTTSRSHGGFDEDVPTRESLTELLRI